jgi:hypothetical protein
VKGPQKWTEGNEQAARIILADPERYAGLPTAWARLWVERHGPARKPAERGTAGTEKQKTKQYALFG